MAYKLGKVRRRYTNVFSKTIKYNRTSKIAYILRLTLSFLLQYLFLASVVSKVFLRKSIDIMLLGVFDFINENLNKAIPSKLKQSYTIQIVSEARKCFLISSSIRPTLQGRYSSSLALSDQLYQGRYSCLV